MQNNTGYCWVWRWCLGILFVGSLWGCTDHKDFDPPSSVSAAGGSATLDGTVPATVQVAAAPSDQYASGSNKGAEFNLTAYVANSFGTPIKDATVVWNASIGTFNNQSGKTDAQGVHSVKLTFPANYTGCSWVTAIASRISGREYVCAKLPLVTAVRLTMDKEELQPLNDKGTMTVTVTREGVPQSGIELTYSLSDSDSKKAARLSVSGGTTNAAGQAQFQVISQNKQNKDVAATVEVKTLNASPAGSGTLSFVIRKAQPAITVELVSATYGEIANGESAELQATYTISGTPQSGISLECSLDNTSVVLLENPLAITGTDGVAVFFVKGTNTTGANVTVKATVKPSGESSPVGTANFISRN